MRKTEIRQLRAYLFVTNTVPMDFEVGKKGRFHFDVHNYGATPASNLRIVAKVNLFGVASRDEHFSTDYKFGSSDSPLAQNQAVAAEAVMESEITQDMMDLYNAQKFIFVAYGKIEYADIFGITRETFFRYYRRPEFAQGIMVPKSDGNHYT
jgi:hypothetical protein